jgi:hypothetical protein
MNEVVYVVCRTIEGDYEDSVLIAKVFRSEYDAKHCLRELEDDFYEYEIQEWEVID